MKIYKYKQMLGKLANLFDLMKHRKITTVTPSAFTVITGFWDTI